MTYRLPVAYKNELLYQKGINYNDVPAWQKRGVGIYDQQVLVDGINPLTGEKVCVKRNRLFENYELPFGNDYGKFVASFLEKN